MSFIKRLLRAYGHSTDPGPDAERRLLARLTAEDPNLEPTRALLRALPEPGPFAEARVRSRVKNSLVAPRPSRRPALTWAGAGVVATLTLITWLAWPQARPPQPIAVAIDTAGADIKLAPDVALHAEGRGHAGGTETAPLIEWEEGRVSVEVTPDQGIDLIVRTPEATVRVIGTGFTVERSALGTTVDVRHGRVQVDCVVGTTHQLSANASVECAPTRPAALLGRARAQASRGDSADVVLATLDSANQPGTPDAIRGELLAFRVETLNSAGRSDAALAAARQYLAEGHSPRRAEVRRIAAAILLKAGGCKAALPLLRDAVAEGGEASDQAALLACDAR